MNEIVNPRWNLKVYTPSDETIQQIYIFLFVDFQEYKTNLYN